MAAANKKFLHASIGIVMMMQNIRSGLV